MQQEQSGIELASVESEDIYTEQSHVRLLSAGGGRSAIGARFSRSGTGPDKVPDVFIKHSSNWPRRAETRQAIQDGGHRAVVFSMESSGAGEPKTAQQNPMAAGRPETVEQLEQLAAGGKAARNNTGSTTRNGTQGDDRATDGQPAAAAAVPTTAVGTLDVVGTGSRGTAEKGLTRGIHPSHIDQRDTDLVLCSNCASAKHSDSSDLSDPIQRSLSLTDPEPLETLGPDLLGVQGPDPLEAQNPGSLETENPNPLETINPDPLETIGPDPVDTPDPDPLDTLNPGPIDTHDPDPIATHATARLTFGSDSNNVHPTHVIELDQELNWGGQHDTPDSFRLDFSSATVDVNPAHDRPVGGGRTIRSKPDLHRRRVADQIPAQSTDNVKTEGEIPIPYVYSNIHLERRKRKLSDKRKQVEQGHAHNLPSMAASSKSRSTTLGPVVTSSVMPPSTTETSPEVRRVQQFYKNYDPMEGVTTAVVLGGFFVLVCMLVIYKTKLKPWWKERNKRLTNTPATRSEANSSFNHIHKDFECLPLRKIPVIQDELEDDDIFYLDEFGNYIFPVSPSHHGTCSCPHSVYEPESRRQSLVSALSNAYTVKSLPGAMLYIPVDSEYNTPVSLKRSLSDPEIYFPSAIKHSLIVAVNGLFSRGERNPAPPLQTAAANRDSQSQGGSVRRKGNLRPVPPLKRDETLQIDINVIQPTPNISPSCSVRSMSGESKDLEPGVETSYAGIPLLVVPASPVKVRRVSFSEESEEKSSLEEDTFCFEDKKDQDNEDASSKRSRCRRQASLQAGGSESPTSRRRRTMASRQLTLPTNLSSMSYLQVPGQEKPVNPRLSPVDRRRLSTGGSKREELGSPLLCRRRLSPQQSIESYYSIASEGDGDIFASSENLGRQPRLHRQASFCLPDTQISQYSEFNEDFQSSISDLFSRRLAKIGTQGTFSEQGSIRSLSIDQEDILYEVPGTREEEEDNSRTLGVTDAANHHCLEESNLDFVEELPFEDGETFMSSSCSISMSSDLESSHQITVPVFIEPAPPEIRFPTSEEHHQQPATIADIDLASSASADIGNLLRGGDNNPRFAHQETMHTDSGLDTEEICPASPTNSRFSADLPHLESPAQQQQQQLKRFEADESLRLVLVRDIGIQCCAESPNLSAGRRKVSLDQRDLSETTERTTNLTRIRSAELLF